MSARSGLAALALLAALAAGGSPARAQAPNAGCTLRVLADSSAANDQGQWPFDFELYNPGPYALSLDSLVMRTTPLAGPRAGRATRARLYLQLQPDAVSAGMTQAYHVELLAQPVTSRLEFEVDGHTREVPRVALTAAATALGYDPLERYPSRVVTVSGRAVEIRLLAPDADASTGAGVLVLPDEGESPRAGLDTGRSLARLGYAVAVVSPPGSGRSQGPADLAGPASLAGAEAGLDSLARRPGVDPARLAAWGTGTGGTLALLLAERREDLKAVVVQSATVDPWAAYRALPPEGRRAFTAAAGRDSAGWRARSPLAGVARLHAPALLVHGGADAVSPPSSVRAFAAAAAAQKAAVDTVFVARSGHALPPAAAFRPGQRFLKSHTGH